MRSLISLLSLAALITLNACEQSYSLQNKAVEIKDGRVTEEYDLIPQERPSKKVDLVFIIDNSGSMQDEQTILAQSLNDFIAEFVDLDLDYRVAFLGTDAWVNPQSSYWNPAAARWVNHASPAHGAFLVHKNHTGHGRNFLDTQTPNLAEAFMASAQLGIKGEGNELPTASFLAATSDGLLQGANAEFFRKDADLIVIAITDEDDNDSIRQGSTNPIPGLENNLARALATNDRLHALKGERATRSTFQLLFIGPRDVTRHLASAEASPLIDYMRVDKTFNFSQTLLDLGRRFAQEAAASVHIPLSLKPETGTRPQVHLNGVSIQEGDGENGFIYDAEKNRILLGSAWAYASGHLRIRYLAQP